jgi:hypothetical protein
MMPILIQGIAHPVNIYLYKELFKSYFQSQVKPLIFDFGPINSLEASE